MVGRSLEIERIAEFIAGDPRGGAGLVLEGEPGIGKTTLWRHGVDHARRRGLRVLLSRPVEAESRFTFGALIDLFDQALDDGLLSELPAIQADALSAALLRRKPGAAEVDQRLVGLAVLGALRLLGQQSPVLLAIDDMHWLEPSSARVLAYALHRLEGAPVAVLGSRRVSGRKMAADALERWLGGDQVSRLRIGPLSLAALHKLVRERLDLALTHPLAARLTRASGGNPFYALEIARLIKQEGLDAADLGASLAIPRGLRYAAASRIARLAPPAREAVVAAFALARPTEDVLEADLVLAGHPAGGIELAVQAQTLELGEGRVELAHPLLGSAAYAELTGTQRRALHSRLSGLVTDPEERVRHLGLAVTGPDAEVAAALEETARSVRARGAPESAAELLDLAVRLTPTADPEARLRRLDQSAITHHVAGDSRSAVALWRQIAREAPPGVRHAHAHWRLAEFGSSDLQGGFEGAPDVLRSIVVEARPDPRLQSEVVASLAENVLWGRGPAAAEPHAKTALRLARRSGDPRALAHARVTKGMTEFFLGRGNPMRQLQQAGRSGAELLEMPVEVRPSAYRGYVLAWTADALPEAAAVLDRSLQQALRERDESSLPMLLWQCCEVAVARGDLDAAASYAAWCRDAVDESERQGRLGASLYCTGLVESRRGNLDGALIAARRALELDEPRDVLFLVALFRGLLCFIELAAGRPQAAAAWAEPLCPQLLAAGYGEPAVFRFIPDQVEALAATGKIEEAVSQLEIFERMARRLGRRSALAEAARAGGLLLAAAGQADAATTELERSAGLERELGRPFHEARALLALGMVARRAKRKAVADDALDRAAGTFERLGASFWADRARSERRRIGLRPAAPMTLTESERRIAALVAAGRSNPEIGRLLFMSRKTVEAHLTSCYRKLGISSRAKLAALAAGLVGEEPPAAQN